MNSDLISFHTTAALHLIALASLVSLLFLKLISTSGPDHFSFLHISSAKSATNAKLLGGLAISSALLFGIGYLVLSQTKVISLNEHHTLLLSLFPLMLFTLYGYVDDMKEIRARYKLVTQVIGISFFSFYNARHISEQNQMMAFAVFFVLGMAFINGTNLLDGLDTLSVKLGGVTSFAFLYVGYLCQSTATIYLSFIHMAALGMFYFYNREPARLYLGEIGGSVIGLIFFVQASLCFTQLQDSYNAYDSMSFVLIAGCLPLCELGISFLRRIYSKKSPFRGDRLHLHYIFKAKYKLSAGETASALASGAFYIMAIGLLMATSRWPVISFFTVVFAIIHCYTTICMSEWRVGRKKDAQNIFDFFEGKSVYVISCETINSVHITTRHADERKKAA